MKNKATRVPASLITTCAAILLSVGAISALAAESTAPPARLLVLRGLDLARHSRQSIARSLVSGRTINATTAVAKASPTGYQRPA
jgi:hypothetical protein